MPSGITSALESKNFDVQKWLLEDVPRQFGICIMLRDESMNLTHEQIRKKLEEDDSSLSYYEEKIKEAEANLVAFKKRTLKQWRYAYEKDKKKALDNFNISLKMNLEKKAKYDKALEQVKTIQSKYITHCSPEVIRNIVAGAVDYLEKSMEWDFGGMKTKFFYMPLEEYIEYESTNVVREITYNKQHIIEEKKRKTDRLNAFDAYVAFIKLVTTE